ncbi:MAG: hypothetical protein AAGH99_02860 [Planctomycetota bacterium]
MLLFACTSTYTAALTPATLLDPELESQPINLTGLNGGTLSYFDDERRLTRAAVDGFVRLTLDEVASEPSAAMDVSLGLIELVEGQRLAGRWASAARDGEALVWAHPTLGRFTLSLDDLRAVTLNQTDAEPVTADQAGTPDGDKVWLNNGDTLTGFIVAIADDSVTIQPDGTANEVTLELSTVAALTLANPSTPAGESAVVGDLIALADGSQVRGRGLSIQQETVSFTPVLADAAEAVELDVSLVRRIDFAAAGLRLVELGDQPMTTVAGGTVFGLDWPAEADGSIVRLHAPVTVVFDLPDGAERFAATALLDLPAGLPEARAALADLELSVAPNTDSSSNDGPPRDVLTLRADSPTGLLNLTLDGAEQLRLDVDPAANGPVLDRLLLRDAVLLIRLPDPQPGSGDPTR